MHFPEYSITYFKEILSFLRIHNILVICDLLQNCLIHKPANITLIVHLYFCITDIASIYYYTTHNIHNQFIYLICQISFLNNVLCSLLLLNAKLVFELVEHFNHSVARFSWRSCNLKGQISSLLQVCNINIDWKLMW